MSFNFSVKKSNREKEIKPLHTMVVEFLILIIGIAFCFLSFKIINNYNEKNNTYIETVSEVVNYVYDDEGLSAIVVEYEVDGKTYKKTSNIYSYNPKKIGTKVAVKYNPKKPNDAIWKNDTDSYLLSLLFIFIGTTLLIFSIKNMRK